MTSTRCLKIQAIDIGANSTVIAQTMVRSKRHTVFKLKVAASYLFRTLDHLVYVLKRQWRDHVGAKSCIIFRTHAIRTAPNVGKEINLPCQSRLPRCGSDSRHTQSSCTAFALLVQNESMSSTNRIQGAHAQTTFCERLMCCTARPAEAVRWLSHIFAR